MPPRWSRRQVVQGAGAVGPGLLAGCGRLLGHTIPPTYCSRPLGSASRRPIPVGGRGARTFTSR